MRRALACLAVMFALVGAVLPSGPARAALDAPDFAAAADRYLATITARGPDAGSATDFLAEVAAAEARGDVAGAIGGYEKLVGKQPGSFRVWLRLAASWRKLDPATEQALGAAYQANRIAGNKSENFESLLMLAGVLRDRMSAAQTAFAAARKRIDNIAIVAAAEGIDLDKGAGTGRAGELAAARVEALRESLVAADRVSTVVAQLDIVYRSLLDDPALSAAINGDAIDAAIAELDTSVFEIVVPELPGANGDIQDYDIAVETTGDFSRACLRFSLPLLKQAKSEFDLYGRFLTMARRAIGDGVGDDGPPGEPVQIASLQVENDRLCLLGLEPGYDYNLTVKEGLPSQNGAELKETTAFWFTVEDRPPTVGFRGASFILPRQGDGEVPVYTVNQEAVPLALMRITDRNLYRHIALGHVGHRMPQEEYRQMRELFSDEMWTGSLAITGKRNKLTTSYIPLLQILEGRQAWIAGGLPADVPGAQARSAETLIGAALKGRYLADPLSYQADSGFDGEAGVFALVTEGSRDDLDADEEDELTRCVAYCAGHYIVQWIVRTDIGLAFYETDQNFHVVARSLKSGAALPRVAVQLVAANNRVLAEGKTDPNGVAVFARRLTEGTRGNRLAVVMAEGDGDFSFIDFGTDRLDLSKLGVYGRAKPGELDAYLYADRGIYRPGNTVAFTALVRTAAGRVPAAMPPVTLSLVAGGSVLDQKVVSAEDWLAGGTTTTLTVPETARIGAAELRASVGDDRHVIGSTVVEIDHFRPDRARLDFGDKADWSAKAAADDTAVVSGSATASYLFGDPRVSGQARAARLKSEVDIRLSAAKSPIAGCFEDYRFGRYDEPSPRYVQTGITGITDADGKLAFTSPPLALPETRQPLQADVTVTLYDNAGPVAARTDSIGLAYTRDWIGVAADPRLQPADDDGAFGLVFDVVGVSGGGQPLGGRTLSYEIFAERNVFVWQRRESVWTPETDVVRTPVSADWPAGQKTITLDAGPAPADGCLSPNGRIAVQLPLGTYVLEVTDGQTGEVVSTRFTTGSNTAENRDPEPDMLGVVSASARYAPGETARFEVSAPFDGEMLVAIADEEIRAWAQAKTDGRSATVEVLIPDDWAGKGLYALVTVFRSGTDGTVTHGPARAMGASYFDVTGGETAFDLKITALGNQPPDKPMPVSVCVADGGSCLASFADRGFVSLYAVDEGLINLTAHPAADPYTHFFGKLALPVAIMDNYGRILLHETSTGEGGDRPTRLALSNYTSDRLVAKVLGPVPLVDGKAEFEVPPLEIDSTIRLVAIAWTDERMAADALPVTVRGSIVARLDTPRFFTPGDKPSLPLLLVNREVGTTDPNGDPYSVEIAASDGIAITGMVDAEGNPLPGFDAGKVEVRLRKGEPVLAYVALNVASDLDAGEAELKLTVTPPAGTSVPPVSRVATIGVRPALSPTLSTVDLELAPGAPPVAFADLVKERAERYAPGLEVQARFAAGGPIVIAGLSPAPGEPPNLLDQLVWTGMIMANQPQSDTTPDNTEEMRRIVTEIQALQASDGSFVPYRTTGEFSDDERNTAEYTVFRSAMVLDLFNTVSGRYGAGRYNIRVGALAERRLVAYLDDALAGSRCNPESLYAMLVLMPFERVRMDDVEEAYSSCGSGKWATENRTPLTKAMLAAVFNQFGKHEYRDKALVMFTEGGGRAEERSGARLAMTLSFLVQAGASDDTLKQVYEELTEFGAPDLQQQAWQARAGGLAAQAAPADAAGPRIEVTPADFLGDAGAGKTTIVTPFLAYPAFVASGLKVRNVGDSPVSAAVALRGVLSEAAAGGDGPFAITRRIFDPAGREIGTADGGDVRVGDNLLVIVEGRRTAEPPPPPRDVSDRVGDTTSAIVIADMLPSALEVVQPDAFAPGIAHQGYFPRGLVKVGDLRSVEAGDDRLVAVVDPPEVEEGDAGGGETADIGPPVDFRIAYYARVIAAGEFVLPPTLVEPMAPPVASSQTGIGRLTVKRPDP